MIEATIIAVGVVIGALVGRWWSVVLAVPAGFLAQTQFSFEGFSGTEVGVLFGLTFAIGLVVGTAIRKVLRALAGARTGAQTEESLQNENS